MFLQNVGNRLQDKCHNPEDHNQQISMRFSIWGLHQKLSCEFDFGSFLSNITIILHQWFWKFWFMTSETPVGFPRISTFIHATLYSSSYYLYTIVYLQI
jgi:hypothetical protein